MFNVNYKKRTRNRREVFSPEFLKSIKLPFLLIAVFA